jgi:hypothetical protein
MRQWGLYRRDAKVHTNIKYIISGQPWGKFKYYAYNNLSISFKYIQNFNVCVCNIIHKIYLY